MQKSFIVTLSSLFIAGLSVTTGYAVETAQEVRFSSETESEAAMRNELTNPCMGLEGVEIRECAIDANRMGSATASRRTELLKRRSTGGRRLAALLERMKRKEADLDSPTNPGMRIDLTERLLQRGTILPARGTSASYEGTVDNPLLRVRTRAGDRKTGGEIPVCSRRDGLRLIYCMQELGIEISPETVDIETWKIYERLYVR